MSENTFACYEIWRHSHDETAGKDINMPLMFFNTKFKANIFALILNKHAAGVFSVVPITSDSACLHWTEYRFKDFNLREKDSITRALKHLANNFNYLLQVLE